LIKEGDEMISEAEDDATRDAVMIAAAQKVEHYEMATYGTLRTWAAVLGNNEAASLLESTLEEEKTADQKLTDIAENFVNTAAAQGGEDEMERSGTRSPRHQAADTRRRRSKSSGRSRARSR
jgi:ferritin-like metal-binding protein YciE